MRTVPSTWVPTSASALWMVSDTLIPIGMRMGVRGGLEGFYAELYIGGLHNVGGGGRTVLDDIGATDLRTRSYCGGLDIGIGWGKKKTAW